MWFKFLYIYEVFYTAAVAVTKVSILLFYWRIFKTPGFKITLITITTVLTGWLIGVMLAGILGCEPIHSFWDFSPGHCINLYHYFLGSGIPNIVLNFLVLFLPLPLVWTLQIPRSQKIALTGIFLLGGLYVSPKPSSYGACITKTFPSVCIVSIIRLVVLMRVRQIDITWSYVNAAIWTACEPTIGIASSCLPIMWPLIKACLDGSVDRTRASRTFRSSKAPTVTTVSSTSPGIWRNKWRETFSSTTTTSPPNVPIENIEDGPEADSNDGSFDHLYPMTGRIDPYYPPPHQQSQLKLDPMPSKPQSHSYSNLQPQSHIQQPYHPEHQYHPPRHIRIPSVDPNFHELSSSPTLRSQNLAHRSQSQTFSIDHGRGGLAMDQRDARQMAMSPSARDFERSLNTKWGNHVEVYSPSGQSRTNDRWDSQARREYARDASTSRTDGARSPELEYEDLTVPENARRVRKESIDMYDGGRF